MEKTKDIAVNPELDLVLERILPVTRQQVFKAWTTPSSFKNWFCPRPWTVSEAIQELHPGGAFITTMQSPEGQSFPNDGCVLEVIENEKLVFTSTMTRGFRPIQSHLPFTAVIKLEDHPQGTKYTAIAIHQDAAGRKTHSEMGFEQGWGMVIDQMVEEIKKGTI
ncbi:hypothetical protein AZI86_05125 [Bdellovibrio bacteriovorus]|uniref:Activator of Hsp90 ATPase homologue 1/2-like C-terminal domain-containing protein n=1 Tax=Bdellovibrio bacteriovorus TaxID=959 RepID=A0A150WPJ9_BDEBC|nr:SRPBCC family protein [Bdellovibrio bacteriovorus]KYG66431.1 hypothetical protein AZI86_05125 [Bdellovibrio bacteriovorus]